MPDFGEHPHLLSCNLATTTSSPHRALILTHPIHYTSLRDSIDPPIRALRQQCLQAHTALAMADQIEKGDQGKPCPCKRIKRMFEGDPEDSSNVGVEDAPIIGICSRPLLVASSDSFFHSNSLERCCWDYAVWPNNLGLFQFGSAVESSFHCPVESLICPTRDRCRRIPCNAIPSLPDNSAFFISS